MVFAEDKIGDEETMKDVAARYFKELVKRCIVQVKREPGKYMSFRLHDLMRDLCLAKAREENFLEVIDNRYDQNGTVLGNSVSSSTGSTLYRRIMIYLSEKDAPKHVVPPRMEAGRNLTRTLAIRATSLEQMIPQLRASEFNKFKMLRSLTIEGVVTPGMERRTDRSSSDSGTRGDVSRLPIGKLIHLRYLNLKKSKLVISPSSISRLERLETLDLTDAKIKWTKKDVSLKLRQLRHLYLSSYDGRDYKLQIDVPNAIEIISGLDCRTMEVKNFSELSNLRELWIYIYEGKDKDVQNMINLVSNSAKLRQAIIFMATLFELFNPEAELALLGQLFRSNLQYLCLSAWLRKLPEYSPLMFRNLSQLRLMSSRLKEDPMEFLEKLPFLQGLVLWDHAFVGEEMACHTGGFPELRSLEISHSHDLMKWTVEVGAMPNLAYLEMTYCESLTSVPEGLLSIATLKSIVLPEGMSEEFMLDYAMKLKMREN